MATMVTNKRYLINFTFYETFKDKPIPHKNFTFLGQGSYEMTGGSAPWYPMWFQNPWYLEGLIDRPTKKTRQQDWLYIVRLEYSTGLVRQ